MRKSDYYIFNRPVSGLDQTQQAQIIQNTLSFFSKQRECPGVIWVLASESNTRYFDRRISFKNKTLVEDKRLAPGNTIPDAETSDKV
jgi:putative ABC transport system ATP-binding protein